ncbi:MAG: DUF4974 domain-containing protein [Tannerellaceae bacterium]
MKDSIKNIVEEGLEEEVNLDVEWHRLVTAIIKQDKTRLMHPVPGKSVYLQLLKYTAAVLVGVCLSITATYLLRETPPELLANNYKLVTDKGEKTYMELPDGTRVWLNSCTTIEYATSYGSANRDLYLNGEAYFEVAKNTKLPFVVKANGVDVTAVGTAFNVSAYKEDTKLVTTLFSGKVAVQPTLTGQSILLNANQVAIYYKDKNRIETIPYDSRLFAQWRGGVLAFDMMYLRDITHLLERNFDVVFCYENQRIKRLRFSGSFRNNETLPEILKVIKTNTAINYQIVKDTVIIK